MSTQPILPGFYPDPTVCRFEGQYYLATSSFEYFPGVPLFRSSNMTDWEQIGHALDRPSQMSLRPGADGASRGIYAPTLRHRDGYFWLAATDMNAPERGQFIVRAKDPAADWTDPVYIGAARGIDPDLAWDADGSCYLTWRSMDPAGIAQARIDPLSGTVLSVPTIIWSGTGLSNTEGPHLYPRNGWWYLVTAEGGTHAGHGVSVARSRSISGPFDAHPSNPVFSRRSVSHPVQAVGHADLVQRFDGSWAAVHLGIRQRGTFPRFHVNGRETFLVGVDWVDGWPEFVEDRYGQISADTSFFDDFQAGELDDRWVAPGADPTQFVSLTEGGAVLSGTAGNLLCARVRDESWHVVAELAEGDGALFVRIDDRHAFSVGRVGGRAETRLVVGSISSVLGHFDGEFDALLLESRSGGSLSLGAPPDTLRAGVRSGSSIHWIATVDGRYLSTEVAGGFTGRMFGLQAHGDRARFTSVRYGVAEPEGTVR